MALAFSLATMTRRPAARSRKFHGPRRSVPQVALHYAALVLLVGLAFACSPRVKEPRPTAPPETVAPAYLIRIGDALDIRFYKTPELNVIKVPVRSDGKISLDLIGDVQAAGLRPEELAHSLDQKYAKELEKPRVSVIVRAFGGQVFVSGEVKTPAAPPFAAGLTALQAISLAGGFSDKASLNDVILMRLEGTQYHGYRLELKKALEGEDFTQDVRLRPADVVFVPRSRIADMGLFVQQYVRDMLPIQFALPLF
jgi:polysaccharide export outer membrane protein